MKFHGGAELDVPGNVYYPEEDSLLLAQEAAKTAKRGAACLDMGCGSGIVAVTMAKKGAAVTASDISKDAVSACQRNAKANDVFVTAIESDLFARVPDKYDLITFNPPYLPAGEGDEYLGKAKNQLIGGKTGREVIGRFLERAKMHLTAQGKILLLISSLTGEKETIAMCEKLGYSAGIAARKKIEWEELIVISASHKTGYRHFRFAERTREPSARTR